MDLESVALAINVLCFRIIFLEKLKFQKSPLRHICTVPYLIKKKAPKIILLLRDE